MNIDGLRGKLHPNRDLSGLTWLQVGGPADYLFQPVDIEDLSHMLRSLDPSVPVFPMQAYAYHLGRDYEDSRAAAQRYIDFYPTEEDAAYAQYLLALSYYDQIDEVGRDQGLTFQALQSLRTVIEVYPDSEYASSAILKFDLAFDHLAGKEMEIGRYYLRKEHYTSAVNRFRVVVEDFQTTTHTAEALHRLVEAYLSLGLVNEAQTAGAILGHNYQSTEWYEDSFKLLTDNGLKMRDVGNNWLSQIYRQSIKGEWL